MRRLLSGFLMALLTMALLFAAQPSQAGDDSSGTKIKHVLLVSIDGMHAVDYINCAKGISGVNGGEPYCPNLAELGKNGIHYLDTSASKPSDSFPGLTAIVTGGSPRSTGVYYDVAYDRVLAPPTIMTGNGLNGSGPNGCTPKTPNGTSTEYEEGIDKDQSFVNGIDGVSTANGDGGINSIDPLKLPRDPYKNCAPVYPWNFLRTNTIFGVAHAAGLYTAWSDKHPAYSSVSGPGDGTNLDDFYGPEINSNVVALPGTSTPDGIDCTTGLDLNNDTSSWTNSFVNVKCYDTLKVNAVLNEIDGYNHNHSKKTEVPAIFGMNFQAVSVGQKLIEKDLNGNVTGTGGYLDAVGTPRGLLLNEIEFVDKSIGEWVRELKKNGLSDSTLVVVTAKHGQSPIDSPRYTRITSTGPVTTSPSRLIDGCLPDSESNAGNQIGPTEDDVSLLWLKSASGCGAASQVQVLETLSPASANIAGIGQIFWGRSLLTFLNKPGVPPNDSRTPDIIVTANVGVTYSKSTGKQAEHGGFAHDDTNVMLLLSNPDFHRTTVFSPVETMQAAPTILKALGLDPNALEAVRIEGTQVLPGLDF